MYLTLRNPQGSLTSVDLGSIPVWDFGLETRPPAWSGFDSASIVTVISAPINGMMVRLVLDALETRSRGDELAQVIAVGTAPGERSLDKARFAEALKILVNSGLAAKDVDEVIANSAAFIDGFWNLRDAMWGDQPIDAVVGRHTNSVSKYAWVLAKQRSGPMFAPVVKIEEVAAKPVTEPPEEKKRKSFPPRHENGKSEPDPLI